MKIVEDIDVVDPIEVHPNGTETSIDPVYQPGKRYTWDPNCKFELTGKEFGLWLNTIRGIITTKEALQFRMALECNNAIEDIMTREVSKGTMIEVPQEVPQEVYKE